jgi:hypothetical protein
MAALPSDPAALCCGRCGAEIVTQGTRTDTHVCNTTTRPPRMHDGLRGAVDDMRKAASIAQEEHDLTSNELMVALVMVASTWAPDEKWRPPVGGEFGDPPRRREERP